ncbi:MAG: hypothetical protein WAV04_01045 [Candidatus Microsaccharimonas sp.]
MSEGQYEKAPDFVQDAALVAWRTYEQDLALLQSSYKESEGRWDAVVDSNAHPYKFLEESKVKAAWLEVKAILLPLYRQYQAAESPQEWIEDFQSKQAASEHYQSLHETTRAWIDGYISYLERMHASTKQLEVDDESSTLPVAKPLDPSVIENVRAEMKPKLRGRHAAEPASGRHRREDFEEPLAPMRSHRHTDGSLTLE